MNISKAMSICFKNDTKIYPIVKGRGFNIKAEYRGKYKVYEEYYTKEKLNKALVDKYITIANVWLDKNKP